MWVHQSQQKVMLHVPRSEELKRRGCRLPSTADSSSANAMAEVFPDAEIMTCGGHAGHAHRKRLEARAKQKVFSKALIARYEKQFPEVHTMTCHCPGITRLVVGA